MAAKDGKDQGIEYALFTQAKAGEGEKAAPWQEAGSKTVLPEAMKAAQALFESGEYARVEIKQRYFEKKNNRTIEVTLKVFEADKGGGMPTAAIFAIAVLCGGLAFGVTYFLTK